MPAAAPPKKIAILGGGIGGLAAAFHLTTAPDWKDHYKITVYQLGWRLGGKCASGRDRTSDGHLRIYEHGLHIFAGFYHNAFAMLRDAYAELGRPAGHPQRTVWDAFKPQDKITLIERVNSGRIRWNIDFLPLPGEPGTGEAVPSIASFIEAMLAADWSHLTSEEAPEDIPRRAALPDQLQLPPDITEHLNDVLGRADKDFADRILDYDLVEPPEPRLHFLAHTLILAHTVAKEDRRYEDLDIKSMFYLLHGTQEVLGERVVAFSLGIIPDWLRRALLGTDLATAVTTGVIADDIATLGFDHIDNEELKEWLKGHGASQETVDWAPVAASYDYVFGYADGDPNKPAQGAGTALRGFLRLLFAYKGHLFWEMKGAMGDVVIAPLYTVLQQRGVKFRFFEQVRNLKLDASGSRIAQIELRHQLRIKPGGYKATISFPLPGGFELESWPATPRWERIVDGAVLEAAGQNPESPWYDPGAEHLNDHSLNVDQHFDLVVLATSLAEVKRLTPALATQDPTWQSMVDQIKTTRTLALQLWMMRSVAALGAPGDRVLTANDQPFSTWSDMTFLLDWEGWPAGAKPESLAYFCGQMTEGNPPDDLTNPSVPALAEARARAEAVQWLKKVADFVWPSVITSTTNAIGFNTNELFDAAGAAGMARFDSQFWRANIAHTERYVQHVPGSVQFRKRADQSGFTNLYLAGDWTLNGINAGCVEAAVMSGMQAARAIKGDTTPIPGEGDV